MLLTILHPPPTIEHPPSINNHFGGSVSYTAMNCIALLLNWVLRGQSFQYVLVYNLRNMHAMPHRSEFCTCSCRVNSSEPAVWFIVSLPSAVFRVRWPSILIPMAMLDSKSLNTTLLEGMISSKHEHVIIRDLSNLTLQIIFNAWWASMNVGSKQHTPWNESRHGPLWWLYIHCGIEETGSPGMITIVCYQARRHPSEHETSSMGK